MKKYIWPSIGFATGILPGFFLVFNFIFTDVSSLYERIFSLLVVAAVYLVLGAALGLAGGGKGLKGAIWLSLPALALSLIYSFKEKSALIISLLYSAAALVPSIAGFRLGAWLSRMKKQ